MSRPRDSHDLRLLDTALLVAPQPSEIRWIHDVFGNSIVVTLFADKAELVDLRIDVSRRAFSAPSKRYGSNRMPGACLSITAATTVRIWLARGS